MSSSTSAAAAESSTPTEEKLLSNVAPAQKNYKQEFTQQVIHKYGWGSELIKVVEEKHVCYKLRVTLAWQEVREFVGEEMITSDSPLLSTHEDKEAVNLVYKAALEGLHEEIQEMGMKPIVELKDVFVEAIDVYESNRENWNYFWSHKPTEVGIDVEGNQIQPPVLVQVATNDYCILEVPRKSLSPNLQRLLRDSSIKKIFCDNFGHKDKKCLGIDRSKPRDDIVELETLASEFIGPSNVARGLARLVNLTMPDLTGTVLVGKPKRNDKKGRFKNIGKFALIEQGKIPPLKNLQSLSSDEQQYAALDAYVTLQVYRKLMMMREEPG